MSTGMQFQLYLALRLAGYEEFAALRPPVPFVADDIMESFDNLVPKRFSVCSATWQRSDRSSTSPITASLRDCAAGCSERDHPPTAMTGRKEMESLVAVDPDLEGRISGIYLVRNLDKPVRVSGEPDARAAGFRSY
ncbi:hypothetical protein RHEC894_PA00081 (plasmid) [Rhizobium sp. CIAT894]|nr:hypothetical protein RHEC894_PA00081 [Rhizobium sp. CIAT894]